MPRPIEVLQRDGRRVNAGELGCYRVVFGEGDRDRRVIDDVARCDIRVQTLNMLVLWLELCLDKREGCFMFVHTCTKVARSGGQEQGILTGWPSAPFTAPSQSPVPV